MHGCIVYTERAETAAVSRCTTEKRTEKGTEKGTLHCTEKGTEKVKLHREREITQRKGQRKGDCFITTAGDAGGAGSGRQAEVTLE